MNVIRKISIGIGVILIVMIALFLHYTLPRTAVVQISGIDMKRTGTPVAAVEEQKDVDLDKKIVQQVTDVRFINSLSRKGKTMVFRNEDTGWGWPPYFKFSSADISAKAQAYASDPAKPWVLVKYYGWRFTVTSSFPNVLNLRVVDRDYSHIPLFNIVVIGLLVVAVFFIRKKVKALVAWLRGKDKPADAT
jgi:hypothetical protein